MADTTTILGRSRLVFPELGYSGGTTLEELVKDILTSLSDDLSTRYKEYTSINDSTTVELYHNFGAVFSEYRIIIYTGNASNLVRVDDPLLAGWTIQEKVGAEKTHIQIITPATGQPHNFIVLMSHGTFIEKINDLDDVDLTTPAEEGQALVWDGSKFIPGASGDSSLKLQAISGTDLTIKSGFMLMSDGRELRLASDMTYDLSGIVANGDYYVYVDVSLLPAATYFNGRKVYALTSAMITLLENTADEVSNSNYAYLGTIQRAAGVWVNHQTGAFRRHDLSTGDVKGATYTLTATQVDALMPLTHTLGVPPELSLKIFDGTDYEYHDAGAYFKSSTTQIKSTGTSLASVLGGATTVIFSYSAGTPTLFVPNNFWKTKIVAANDAVLANDQIFANTTGGAITLTLPLAPGLGDSFRVVDFNGSWDATNKVTLDGNGKNILGAATYELTIADSSEELVYNGTEWRVI